MPRPPWNPPRKRRTREHVLADLSVNHLEKYALRCGYAVERISNDYGLDLAIFTFDEFAREKAAIRAPGGHP
ncbi:MAG: hypothetical protein L0215_26250 [Gemmataceae bacterium]|nr:hypothetical protein [Gemmataceae bacterium]